jgi:hypothetical protein
MAFWGNFDWNDDYFFLGALKGGGFVVATLTFTNLF